MEKIKSFNNFMEIMHVYHAIYNINKLWYFSKYAYIVVPHILNPCGKLRKNSQSFPEPIRICGNMQKCIICDSTKNIQFHTIISKTSKYYRYKHSKEYREKHLTNNIPLCSKCHNRLHKFGLAKVLTNKELLVKWIYCFKIAYNGTW